MNSTPVNQVSYHSLRGCYPLGWLQAYIFLNVTDKTKRKECGKLQAALLCIAHMKAIHVQSLPQTVRMCSNANAKLRSSLSTTWSPSSCWSWQQVGAASRKELRKQRSSVCPRSPWMSHSLHGTCAQCRQWDKRTWQHFLEFEASRVWSDSDFWSKVITIIIFKRPLTTGQWCTALFCFPGLVLLSS